MMSDIRPSLGQILESYERLSYKARSALSELVDNSTASYFQNKEFLINNHKNEEFKDPFKLKIVIEYDKSKKTLTVTDNAMGMDKNELYNALKIANRPKDTSGRNEFGMGLKTSASWFSKKWEVITKKANSKKSYKVVVDIKNLLKTGQNDFIIEEEDDSTSRHYTIIRLSNITRTISNKMLDELKLDLASTYRQDLLSKEIELVFEATGEFKEYLFYEPEPIFIDKTDGINIEKKVNLDTYVELDGKKYFIKGFVGILQNGSYKKAGFTLLRRNRVIIGGLSKNYKPIELFKSANSFASLRVFGEISLDDWPVTQAKDDFDWQTNGLEELFLQKIYEEAKHIFEFAQKPQKLPIDPKPIEINPETLEKFQDQTKEALSSVKDIEIINEPEPKVLIGTKTSYAIEVRIGSKNHNIAVDFIAFDDNELFSTQYNQENIEIKINTKLPLFQDFSENIDLFSIVQKFIVLMVISESWVKATNSHPEGLSRPEEIREMLNNIIQQIESMEGDYEVV